jgi:hypothetical protein
MKPMIVDAIVVVLSKIRYGIIGSTAFLSASANGIRTKKPMTKGTIVC